MNINKRLESLDFLRGMALMFIILFHASIYNFANIHKLDFGNPPIVVLLMSFMALWGGIFIIYSMVVNARMLFLRSQKGADFKIFSYSIFAGIVYIFFHYLLNIVFGRWNIDFISNMPDLTVAAGSFRNMQLTLPHITKFFEGSSISAIAFNLIILSLILYFIFKNGGIGKAGRDYFILGMSGFLIMVFSFVRVPIFELFSQSISGKNYLLAAFFSFTVANPYPLLPYLAYGIFGAMIGIMLYLNRDDLFKKIIIPLGVFFGIYGLAGMINFQKTISKPDYFWYFKTNFELGLFLLMLVFTIIILQPRAKMLGRLSPVMWFSRVSFTVYMLETLISEINRIVWLLLIPGWDQTINGCLAFGAANVIIWVVILFFWRKNDFKYSLEYFWVLFFNKLGRKSTKMDSLP